MKKLTKFSALLSILLLLLGHYGSVQGALREYRSHLENADWVSESTKYYECVLKQQVPFYGEVVFLRKAGQEMKFELRSEELFLKNSKIKIMSEPAPWRHDSQPFEIGQFVLQTGHKPLKVSSPFASRMFQQVENGMAPAITYRDVADQRDLISVSISPVRFRKKLSDFRKCESELLPYDAELLRDFNIYFATNKAALTARAKKNLGDIVKFLKIDTEIKQIKIDTHADERGRRRFNDKLSKRRADSIEQFLLKMGADSKLLVIKAHGERQPAFDNKTALGRSKNRRGRIQLLKEPPAAPVVEGEKPVNMEQYEQRATDSLDTPVPNFINLEHLITPGQ